MGDLFPEQNGGSVGCGPIIGAIGLLTFLAIVFLMAQGSGFFEAFWQIGVFAYEIIDELWEA